MLFKIYYTYHTKGNNVFFISVPAENLIDKLNTLRKSDDIKLFCIQDCYGKKFML